MRAEDSSPREVVQKAVSNLYRRVHSGMTSARASNKRWNLDTAKLPGVTTESYKLTKQRDPW